MIRLRVVLIILVVGLILVWVSTTIHDTWMTARAVDIEHIRERDLAIAQRDAGIQSRDERLRALRLRDSLTLRHLERQLAQKLSANEHSMIDMKLALDADARAHGDMVTLPAVHSLELHYEAIIADCKNLNTAKDNRITNLLAQGSNQDTTRKALDTTRVQMDSTRHDLDVALHPAWWRRVYGWIADRAPAAAVGVGIGLIVKR